MTVEVGATARDRRRSGRLTRCARAALLAVGLGFVLSVAGGDGADTLSGRLGGDFPAFYAAGSIVAAGDWEQLYDADRQLAEQAALFPGADGTDYLYFAYPPHAAAAYRPLAALGYRTAYVVHTLAMVAALAGALALVRPMSGLVRRHYEAVLAGSLLLYPMLRAVTGGQNTAVSLLALAATWRLLHEERDGAAGAVLALLLYKPQLALPMIGLLAVVRRWRAGGAALGGGLVLWALAAAVMGPGWLSSWWRSVSDFAALDAEVNGHNAVSWLGVAEAVLGASSVVARAAALPLMAATVAGLVWLWARPATDLAARMAITTVGVVLLSPHAMFYDVGLLVLAGVVALDRLGARAALPIAAAWAAAWLQLGGEALGVAPLFGVVVLFGGWLVFRSDQLSAGWPAPAR